jgi:hypothetical protein
MQPPFAPFFFRRPRIFGTCFSSPFCSPFFGFGLGFGSGFFCDPFFFGPCVPPFGGGFFDPVTVVPPAVGLGGEFVPGTVSGSEPPDLSDGKAEPPITFLALKNGSQYGLTDYWVEGDNLHYITNYGGENSVALGQIDIATTVRLNGEQGIDFVLHPKLASPETK